ncbi:GIY-YIG nuclease family protein [Candidatus Omnitrophota bacterium]
MLISLKDSKFYTGYTDDINRRLYEHEKGLVSSTKYRRPLKLIYYECGGTKEDAIRREGCLKSGRGKRYLRTRLSCFMSEKVRGLPRTKFRSSV